MRHVHCVEWLFGLEDGEGGGTLGAVDREGGRDVEEELFRNVQKSVLSS